jgi:chromosome segregation ATPase
MEQTYDLTIQTTAQILGKSVRQVRRYVRDGHLTVVHVPGKKGQETRFQKNEVLKLRDMLMSPVSHMRHESQDTNVTAGPYSLTIQELWAKYEEQSKRLENANYLLGGFKAREESMKMLEAEAHSLRQENRGLNEKVKQVQEEQEALVTSLREKFEQDRAASLAEIDTLKSELELKAKALNEKEQAVTRMADVLHKIKVELEKPLTWKERWSGKSRLKLNFDARHVGDTSKPTGSPVGIHPATNVAKAT